MHICIFFDDVIKPPFKTCKAIFLTKFFSILGRILIFGEVLLIFSVLGP